MHICIISFSFKFIYYPELKKYKPKTWEAFFMAVLMFSPEQESGTHSPTVSGRFEYCSKKKKKKLFTLWKEKSIIHLASSLLLIENIFRLKDVRSSFKYRVFF